MNLSILDLSIIIATLIIVFIIKLRASRGINNSNELFLGGRTLGWFVIGFSLFASNISSTTLIGNAGAAYMKGLFVSNYEWMASVILIIFAIYFIPAFLRNQITTVPEWLELRFDKRTRKYFSAMTILSNIIIDTAGSLFAGAMVIKLLAHSIFPDIDTNDSQLFYGSIALLAIFSAFTAEGGLKAVVFTDTAQAIILLIGSSMVTYFVFEKIDFNLDILFHSLPEKHLSIFLPLDDPDLPWLGSLIGVPILGFYFWCTNQFIVQRILGAKDITNARLGAIFAGFLKLFAIFIMVFPGVMARVYYPGLDNPDSIYPKLISELLPTGIYGLVLGGFIAAIMSSIDSTLISASTLITMDFLDIYPLLHFSCSIK